MPVLTEEELKSLKNKADQAERNLVITKAHQKHLQEEIEDERKRKKAYLIGFIICLFLVFVGIGIFFGAPELVSDERSKIASNEIIVKKSEIDSYETTISQLEQFLAEEKSIHPLDLNEFYAVQLGAFKKFNTRLSSDSYSLVRNANYQDFNLFTLGVFESEEEAEKLREVVSQLNFKDAFVGKYQNGERIDAQF